MESKKTQNKKIKESKKKSSPDDMDDERPPRDEREIEEMLEEEMPGELDEEDDEEFIQQVEEFEKDHSKVKMVSVYKKIGKPKFKETKKVDPKDLKAELRRLIVALDVHHIIVHSHGEYDDKEKYRFVTEEVFNEVIEDNNKQITFVYEDYHPEMEEKEETEEGFDENFN
ncbi:MAG: hypothetical protein SGI89_01620 [bacterium]|nr:hypothetical protein [bacterium]